MSTVAPGAHIELRDAVWRVVRVDQTSTGMAAWRCVGVSEIVRDREALFLEELEPKVTVLDPRETNLVRDTSSQHRAGLLYIESLLRDVPPTGPELVAGHKAAMDELPFQLEPAYKALCKPRQRLLIADAVGLGKTLSAGVLLAELIRRGKGRRILVATVKSMLTQFQKEMWCRFSIPLVRLDSTGLQKIRGKIPTHHNPFYYFDKCIISIDTLKQNNAFASHVEQAHWDVIVVDEAHNVAARGHGRSQRARIAEVLARNCDSMILLSATPHDGRPASFASLMNMLDPTAIADPEHYTPDDIKGLFERRFKADVADQIGKAFPERRIYKARAQASAAEEEAFDRLTALSFTRIDQKAHGGMLFKTTLEKGLFSSPAACVETINERIGRLRRREGAGDFEQDIADLQHLREAVEDVCVEDFSKYQELLRVIRKRMEWTPRKGKEDRLVIFTERRATLSFLRDNLQRDLKLKEAQIEVLHGGLADTEQQRIVEEFGNSGSKIRLLLASDVASEGINLHYLCHRLIHFDVPWSLMVFQQRNGRVDRYGQEQQPLLTYLLTESDNDDIKGDTRILEVLIVKDEQAAKNIGDPSAFMNVFDVAEEEKITAQSMEAGTTAEAFDAKLDAALSDPFAAMLAAAAVEGTQGEDGGADDGELFVAPTVDCPSLYVSDFAYVHTALQHLKADGVRSTSRPKEQLIELTWTDDLQQRFDKLPAEIRPDDGVVLLTADRDRMQRAMKDARKEESSWPRHQYLWANNPVVEWIGDRMRAGFGRHTAPVLALTGVVDPDEVAVIVSGLLPNQRSQPLVHRWYVAIFRGGDPVDVEALDEFLQHTDLDGRGMPNREVDLDFDTLQAMLPLAVGIVSDHIGFDRQSFEAETRARLDEELQRLDRLRGRQLAWIQNKFGDDPRRTHQRDAETRRVTRLFDGYQQWAKEAMTTADTPFLQVIAVICHAEGDSVKTAGGETAR